MDMDAIWIDTNEKQQNNYIPIPLVHFILAMMKWSQVKVDSLRIIVFTAGIEEIFLSPLKSSLKGF